MKERIPYTFTVTFPLLAIALTMVNNTLSLLTLCRRAMATDTTKTFF